jgi:tetratricopeptide (TPR) repeat protein
MYAAPQVRFIVTSRALLGIEGEREFELLALPLPDAAAETAVIMKSEAVRLFVERARLQHVGFALTESSAAAVARIVQRLEGMPLAIELAAARTVIMQPEQIAERMDKLFDVLKSTRRDLAPRQRSLNATLDWSYDLLTDAEKWAFAQLSVFQGGFFLDAAEKLLDLSRFADAPSALDMVQSLREKSLLRAIETPYETRFAMYQLIREYAAQRWLELADEPERLRTAEKFARYYRDYGSEWDHKTNTTDIMEALDRLDYARGNMEAAMEFVAATPSLPDQRELYAALTLGMNNLLRIRGPSRQRVPHLRRALAVQGSENSGARVRLLFLLSLAEREAGDPVVGSTLAAEAVAAAEQVGDEQLLATAKFHLAGIEYAADKVERAQQLHREVLPIFRRLGNRHNEGRVLSRMALLEAALGNFDEAIKFSLESEKLLRELGDLAGAAWALTNRGSIYNRFGRHLEALENIEKAEVVYRELDDRRMLCLCLGNRALMTRQVRNFELAEKLVAECDALARELGDQITLAKNLMNAGIMYVELERHADAESSLREASKIFEASDHPHMKATCVEYLSYQKGLRGDLDGALKGFDRALELYGRKDDQDTAGVHGARAEILLAHGREDEARAEAERALAFWRGFAANAHRDYFRALVTLVKLTGDAAARDEALKLADAIYLTEADPAPRMRESLEFLKINAAS